MLYISCPCCRGAAEIPLPNHLLAVVEYLRANGPATTTTIRLALAPNARSHTLINNRLRDLEAHGLVRRKSKNEKTLTWELTERGIEDTSQPPQETPK